MNVFSFSSSAKGQTTQTTPLIEARSEKTKKFQTQLLHYFSKSDNKSNHHHQRLGLHSHCCFQGACLASHWRVLLVHCNCGLKLGCLACVGSCCSTISRSVAVYEQPSRRQHLARHDVHCHLHLIVFNFHHLLRCGQQLLTSTTHTLESDSFRTNTTLSHFSRMLLFFSSCIRHIFVRIVSTSTEPVLAVRFTLRHGGRRHNSSNAGGRCQ